MNTKIRNPWLLTGLSLILIGLFVSAPQFLQFLQTTSVPKASASVLTSKAVVPADTKVVPVEGKPHRLSIPSLAIDLPIVDGSYNAKTQKWTLSNDKVHYAVSTPLANTISGNTFLYGHNRKGVLRDLFHIELGAEAIVYTDNNKQFTYTFTGAIETTPDDKSVFEYQGAPILTIQTCSGLWYQNRQLFTFSLKEVQ